MKVIIAGSRSIASQAVVDLAIQQSGFLVTEVVSGGARGADKFGEAWAVSLHIRVKRFLANWRDYGMKAGYMQNVEMSEYADALVAVWDGQSKGTAHMISIMERAGKRGYVHRVDAKQSGFEK